MAAPANTVLPAITGTVEVGYTLACSQGTWTGGVQSYAFQWYRVNDTAVAVTGATTSAYIVSALDTGHALHCTVTATNNTGSTAADSADTITVPTDWLVVETGAALADANTYCSLAYADTYHSERGNTAWPLLSVGARKAALVRATDWLEQRYLTSWAGDPTTDTQALAWPRAEVLKPSERAYYLDDEMPDALRRATAELALRASTATLTPDQTAATVQREKVGPLEVEYSPYSNTGGVNYPVVQGLIAHLLGGPGPSSIARQAVRV